MNQLLLTQIKSNPKYYDYLKENSYWLKNLNRHSTIYKEYVAFIKDKYHLRPTDKIASAIDDIDLVANILTSLK